MIYVVIPSTASRKERRKKCIEALEKSKINYSLVIYEGMHGGVAAAAREAISGIDGEIFLLNDDMIVSENCLVDLKNTYDIKFPQKDGVCQPVDSIRAGTISVCPYGHTKTIKPFLEEYNHYFWDAEIAKKLKQIDKYIIVQSAKVTHEHHSVKNLNIKIDATYISNSKNWLKDRSIFFKKMKNIIL